MASVFPPKRIVLVVEDEPIMRMAAVDMIEQAGFQVLEASDATNAVTILESRPDIRLVFTDIDMPRGMDGLALAACIRKRWPPIEVIITSGHAKPELNDLPARCVFIAKPYQEREVLSAMNRMAREI